MVEPLNQENLDKEKDRALGCILGAFVGDAAGAPLEFITKITPEALDKALKMQGKGKMVVGPGKYTDDSELAMSLCQGLVECGTKFDANKIVKYYGMWYESPPFDIGHTTRVALCNASSHDPNAQKVYDAAQELNKMSESNGSLMRITPLAVWCRNLSIPEIIKIVPQEVALTHSNLFAKLCATAYCIGIKYLIKEGSRERAWEEVKKYILSTNSIKMQEVYQDIENNKKINAGVQIGWLRIGFTYAFQFLNKKYDYKTAITEMLKEGGDTDTNAAIVGGLIGAADGLSKIPQDLLQPVIKFDGTNGIPRPDFLFISKNPNLLEKLFANSPTKLE